MIILFHFLSEDELWQYEFGMEKCESGFANSIRNASSEKGLLLTHNSTYDSIFGMKVYAKLLDKLIVADPKDNVATARVEIDAGVILSSDDKDDVIVSERIPFGHKMALERIARGEPVIKYGQRIGVAMSDIDPGDLVHTHNLSGERGTRN
jgi:altronate dehydratase small subunit